MLACFSYSFYVFPTVFYMFPLVFCVFPIFAIPGYPGKASGRCFGPLKGLIRGLSPFDKDFGRFVIEMSYGKLSEKLLQGCFLEGLDMIIG